MGEAPLWLDVLLFGSLGLLGVGYFLKTRKGHLWRVAGFVGFGLFWGGRSALFIYLNDDAINILFTGLAMPFYVYLGWHEWTSYKKDEEIDALKWAAGASFLGGLLYFSVDRFDLVAGALIQVVAWQSLWLMNAFGYGTGWTVGPTSSHDYDAGGPLPPELGAPIMGLDGTAGSGVTIILGCTSYEAIVIFLGAIFAVQMRQNPWADYKRVNEAAVAKLRKLSPQRRQMMGLLYTIPVIWVLNLVRNAGVIYLYNEGTLDGVAGSMGMTGFEFAHTLLGKGLSFIALIAIAFILFKTCPEILDNVNGLIDLPRRGKGGKRGGEGEDTPGDSASAEPVEGADAPTPAD